MKKTRGTVFRIFLSLFVTSSQANGLAEDESHPGARALDYHPIRFYIEPRLVPDIEFTRRSLQKYVDDKNAILAKNTFRRLVFDPVTGVVLTTEAPHSGSFGGEFPQTDFEIWVYIRKAKVTWSSYGGSASFDRTGAGVLDNFFWLGIYDPETVTSIELEDYAVHLGYLMHELGHAIAWAGMGELYSFDRIEDTTGELPYMPSSVSNYPNDPYWHGDKWVYFPDPMFGGSNLPRFVVKLWDIRSRQDLVDALEYSPLTAALLNGRYRGDLAPSVPDLRHIHMLVSNTLGMPIAGAYIRVWNVDQSDASRSTLEAEGYTDQFGFATFAWVGSPFNNVTGLKLVKVYRNGFQPTGRYISFIDLQEQKVLYGNAEATFPVAMAPVIRSEIVKRFPSPSRSLPRRVIASRPP